MTPFQAEFLQQLAYLMDRVFPIMTPDVCVIYAFAGGDDNDDSAALFHLYKKEWSHFFVSYPNFLDEHHPKSNDQQNQQYCRHHQWCLKEPTAIECSPQQQRSTAKGDHHLDDDSTICGMILKFGVRRRGLPPWLGGTRTYETWRKRRLTQERKRWECDCNNTQARREQNRLDSIEKRKRRKAEIESLKEEIARQTRSQKQLKAEHGHLTQMLDQALAHVAEMDNSVGHCSIAPLPPPATFLENDPTKFMTSSLPPQE